jgi:ATP-dependent DNA helicase PIF1
MQLLYATVKADVGIRSFGGVGLAKEAADVLADKVMKSRNARMRWMEAKVLIIDEVSMIDGGLFDKLELIARTVRRSNKPFGGIQILLSGKL